jgi:hypothetical protein
VRFGAERRSWYGLLYSLGARLPPYKLVKKNVESAIPVTDPNDSICGQLQLAVNSRPIKTESGGNRYYFILSIQAPSSLKENIAKVDYDLVYEPNPLLLSSNDANTNFEAAYEGWGCYRTVEVIVHLKNAKTQPRKKTFDMCSVLGS